MAHLQHQLIDKADLSEFDLTLFKPMQFEFEKKSAALNTRLPQQLLHALKRKAREKSIPYTRYGRMLPENDEGQR